MILSVIIIFEFNKELVLLNVLVFLNIYFGNISEPKTIWCMG